MSGAQHFEELDCWQLANEFKLRIYRVIERPVIARDFRFRDQIRDAASSAPRNIAEGFGRRTHADFAHYLDIARGSLMECQDHLLDAFDRRYIRSCRTRRDAHPREASLRRCRSAPTLPQKTSKFTQLGGAPSHLRTLAPSHPRTLAPSHPRTFAPSHLRTLAPSHPNARSSPPSTW